MNEAFTALITGDDHPQLNQLAWIMLAVCIGLEIVCYLMWRLLPRWCWVTSRIISTLMGIGWSVLCAWHLVMYSAGHEGSLRGSRGPKALFVYGIAVGAMILWMTIREFRGDRHAEE